MAFFQSSTASTGFIAHRFRASFAGTVTCTATMPLTVSCSLCFAIDPAGVSLRDPGPPHPTNSRRSEPSSVRSIMTKRVLLFFFRARLKSSSEVIQRLVEEIPNCIIELLNAVQLQRKHFAPTNRFTGKDGWPVLANIAAQMLFYQNYGVDDFAHRDFLLLTSSPPVLVFGAYTLMVGAREPIPQSVAQAKNPRFQLRFGKAVQGGCVFVGYEILDNFACQGLRVSLDQLNQCHGKHLNLLGENAQRSASQFVNAL